MRGLSRHQVLGGLLTVIVLAAITGGLVLHGSPAEERARRIDERRVDDLDRLERAVDLYWTRHGVLPASLEELQKEPGGRVRTTDPDTGEPYEYRLLDSASYELCARFERETRLDDRPFRDGFWSHGSGRQCFRCEAPDAVASTSRIPPVRPPAP